MAVADIGFDNYEFTAFVGGLSFSLAALWRAVWDDLGLNE